MAATQPDGVPGAELAHAYARVRQATEALCAPLSPEDCLAQSASEVSPTKWHLAHTTWFFETFVLRARVPSYSIYDPTYEYLFNSYYNAVGPQYPRPQRGLITRPSLEEVFAYRRHVDAAMRAAWPELSAEAREIVELGLHHEQQHQELILMDIKHVLSCNPLHPAYGGEPAGGGAREMGWLTLDEGIHEIGHGGEDFAFDHEAPRHKVYLRAAALADRLVTNAELLAFVEDGGYQRPELWLSDGWDWLQSQRAAAPLYWVARSDGWHEHTLAGLRALNPAAPVCHVSYYEADAYASWAGCRLPTEAEWEALAARHPLSGHFADDGILHPAPAGDGQTQLFGDCWEWTQSALAPYPGYEPPVGALGEYNGKFMCNQYVLRGGSCVTPADHMRVTYRNFFYPWMRWPFTGIRLARDV